MYCVLFISYRESSCLFLLLFSMKTEAEKRVHECPECPLSFNNKKSLSTHMRTHNGLKTYKCDSCGKEFSQIGSLKRHEIKFHGIVKPNSNNKKRKNVPDPEAQDSLDEQSPPKKIKTTSETENNAELLFTCEVGFALTFQMYDWSVSFKKNWNRSTGSHHMNEKLARKRFPFLHNILKVTWAFWKSMFLKDATFVCCLVDFNKSIIFLLPIGPGFEKLNTALGNIFLNQISWEHSIAAYGFPAPPANNV